NACPSPWRALQRRSCAGDGSRRSSVMTICLSIPAAQAKVQIFREPSGSCRKRSRVSGLLCAVTDESAGYTALRRCIPCRLGKGEGRDGVEALSMDLVHDGRDFPPHPGPLPCGFLLPTNDLRCLYLYINELCIL